MVPLLGQLEAGDFAGVPKRDEMDEENKESNSKLYMFVELRLDCI